MDFSDPVQARVFFELHNGLPRQSPGSDASTLKALDIVKGRLPDAPLISDFGCGPGSSAIALARALPSARIIAFDLYPPFAEETAKRAAAAGVGQRIDAKVGDMTAPPVEPGSLDLIWCEGAIYFLGVENGLTAWRRHLRPGGLIVFNEPAWMIPEAKRPKDLKACWAEYPGMMDEAGVLAAIDAAGFDLIDRFPLPDADWWDAYYRPMEQSLTPLEAKYAGREPEMIPMREGREEIEVRRAYPDAYNYWFYCTVMRAD